MVRPLACTLFASLACAVITPSLAAERDDAAPGASGPLANAASNDDFSLRAPLRVVGLTDAGQLVCFSDRQPQRTRVLGTVAGFGGSDSRLIGIDFRPQDGLLYGVGNGGGLYRVDTTTAALTAVGQLSTAPDPAATAFGVDFNPAANALRIVSDTGQNLRHPFADPAARTAEDKALTNPAAPPATGSVPAEGVGGAGYTNNDTDAATATALFVLDTEADRLSIQSPANAGTLAPVGNLGVDAGVVAGFDVHSPVPGGPSTDMLALATLQVDDRYGLYEIDLLTGKAERLAELAGPVIDIAIPIDGG
jgi:hypothetical protein